LIRFIIQFVKRKCTVATMKTVGNRMNRRAVEAAFTLVTRKYLFTQVHHK